ncbi:MAG: flagellar basal body P-ring protein FlgI [Planctomycetota bacterium]
MTRMMRRTICAIGAILALVSTAHGATSLDALVRIKGHETNVFVGVGIVTGLTGTGDSVQDSYIAARPYAQMLSNLGTQVGSLEELRSTQSFAVVHLYMTVGPTGAREGDELDVIVTTAFDATSLDGGQLMVSPLRLPLPDRADLEVYAVARGQLELEGDIPTRARVQDGGKMLKDIRPQIVNPRGMIELIIDSKYAGPAMSATIADAINAEFEFEQLAGVADAIDSKTIEVRVPTAEVRRPMSFVRTLTAIPIDITMIDIPPRIVINRKEGTIVLTGDVEVSPSIISHAGLTINPLNDGLDGGNGLRSWASLDTSDGSSRSSRRLGSLIQMFDQLNVPMDDRIQILQSMDTNGVLHGEIIYE